MIYCRKNTDRNNPILKDLNLINSTTIEKLFSVHCKPLKDKTFLHKTCTRYPISIKDIDFIFIYL